jgi:chemotaxis response regulator CheB
MTKVRALVVDDHAIVRAGPRMLINPQPDMEVVGEAADGHEALCQAREANPDVLTLDLTMPGGGGLKILEGLRQACPQTRALVLTRHEEGANNLSVTSANLYNGERNNRISASPPHAVRAAPAQRCMHRTTQGLRRPRHGRALQPG